MSTSTCMCNNSVKSDQMELAPFNIALNIEGKTFQTSEFTVKSISGSLLGQLDTDSKFYNKASNSYCFDRDSNLFPHILSAHRDGEVHVPKDVCAIRFRKELEFWKIPRSLIAPCCWNYYYTVHEDIEILKQIVETLPKEVDPSLTEISNLLNGDKTDADNEGVGQRELTVKAANGDLDEREVTVSDSSWLYRLWLLLEEPKSSKEAMIYCAIFLVVVAISVTLHVIWLEESVRVDPYLAPNRLEELEQKLEQRGNTTINGKIRRAVLTDPHIVLLTLDCLCTLFFTLEVCVHFAACPNKRQFLNDWFRGLKVFLAACMVYSMVFELRKDWLTNDSLAIVWFLTKSMNSVRILLTFKLAKVNCRMNIMLLSIRNCQKEMGFLILLLLTMVFLYGGLMFAFEMDSDMFPDTSRSMWWALITMTTIGYGDFYPTRPMGYLVGMVCAIDGIITLALPIAVVATTFSKFRDRYDDIQKHLKVIEDERAFEDENNKRFEEVETTGDCPNEIIEAEELRLTDC